jgi:LemA protein
MSSVQIALVTLAAVLAFWAVGAYNRLMALRNTILQRFGRVDEQLKLRHALLLQHLDALGALAHEVQPADTPPEPAELLQGQIRECAPRTGSNAALQVLRAACLQVHSASEVARIRPAVAENITSLRLAEDILRGALTRAQSLHAGPPEPGGLIGRLSVSETALQYARSRFNDAVHEYNHAVRQFPTCLLAGTFGFRVAGRL